MDPRPLPNALGPEKSILSCMLQDVSYLEEAKEQGFEKDEFYAPAHQIIFGVAEEQADKNAPIDLVSFTFILKERGLLENIGGAMELAGIWTHATPEGRIFEAHLRQVRDSHLLRQIINQCTEFSNRAFNSPESAVDELDAFEESIHSLRPADGSTGVLDAKTALKPVLEEVTAIAAGEELELGIATGYQNLDDYTSGGLHGGELFLIGARASTGKTAFMVSMAMNLLERGVKTLIFSAEMTYKQLMERFLYGYAGVNQVEYKKKGRKPTQDELKRVSDSAKAIGNWPLWVDDTPAIDISQLRVKARRQQFLHGVEVVMLDYLQLATSKGHATRELEVSFISKKLKAIAKELNVPVIAAAQLNRQTEAAKSSKPHMSHLRESGSLEQDADTIGLLYRPGYYDKENKTGDADLMLGKNRNGPTEDVQLTFHEECMRFVERAYKTI